MVAPVADAPGRRLDGQRHRSHQLPDLGQPAQVVAAAPGPGPEVLRVGVELVGTRVEATHARPMYGGASRAMVSMMEIRKGVPLIGSPHPAHRFASFSSNTVGMRMPMIWPPRNLVAVTRGS